MAYRDYILCKTCKCKIVYDGNDNGRNRLETYWGTPEAKDWTVGLLCPDCIGQLEERDTALLRQALEALEMEATNPPIPETGAAIATLRKRLEGKE